MAHLLSINDLGNGQVHVSWRRGDGLPRTHAPSAFTNPLGARDREELRWYLEDYLSFPYGAEAEHAARVEERMTGWGASLFEQVFPLEEGRPGPAVSYQEAVREGLAQCEVCVTSADAAFLGVPWELLYDQTPGRGYLAQNLGGLYRQWSGHAVRAAEAGHGSRPFRILLVIARPYGARDIPLGTVSRPLLEALRPFRSRVELEVLRPPTFDELTRRLSDRPGYYTLVHFDGHGVFVHAPDRQLLQYAARGNSGHLVFETAEGGEHVVNSEDLGQALADCRVPLFLLNACQSAAEGEQDAFASVASQLVAAGAQGVVAMNHSVYADAAALFVGRLYERLLAGASLSEAVAAGRKALFASPQRNSIVGPLELRDWVVPSLYQNVPHFVPVQAAPGATAAIPQLGLEVLVYRGRGRVFGRQQLRNGCVGRFSAVVYAWRREVQGRAISCRRPMAAQRRQPGGWPLE